MKPEQLDIKKYKRLARQAVAEGCVLLLNENKTLPVQNGETISVFGRSQLNYYKSGTGSGGMINVDYVIDIIDGLQADHNINMNEELLQCYQDWVKSHPFDTGLGWAQEPWYQNEMPLSDEMVRSASDKSDIALVILGRTAGEDRDNKEAEGSYYLTQEERAMLQKVRGCFARMAVILNVGNIIDMNWVDEYHPDAVLYAWQGGQEGGNGIADVLTGKVNPCGKLTDTIAYHISDYPSSPNFGSDNINVYTEDIYVGYRYFETAAKEKVMYPFGYGISYTSFEFMVKNISELSFAVTVTNTGNSKGKEIIQIYVEAPQGQLGKPARILVDFGKTILLYPKASDTLHFALDRNKMASYDDSGCTGHKSCYVLEAGEYKIYAGTDVRNVKLAGAFTVNETVVTQQLTQAMAPVKSFERMKPEIAADGRFSMGKEEVPLGTIDLAERIRNNRPDTYPYTGDRGYLLADVQDGHITLEAFLAQLTDEELACIVRGEGMCSPKVTPGTAAAYGGVTEELSKYGIPVACCTDGPSGIRMDCGTKAFCLPCGTLLACTFDRKLNEELYEMEGIELRKHRIEALLGPGINIHRNPLNGRNFEYFSEDPYLTGQIAAAQIRGMHKHGTTGVIKHFCANNQEFSRRNCNSVTSERALREIYLKGFEIAIKEGNAYYVMTSYNPVNGIWSAGNYDLNTTILRNEWGFEGIVMTDWWAEISDDSGKQSRQNTAYMVRAQNDLYMVTADSKSNSMKDNTVEMLEKEVITRGELQRSAANICKVLMRSYAMDRLRNPGEYEKSVNEQEAEGTLFTEDIMYYEIYDNSVIDLSHIATTKGSSTVVGVKIRKNGEYKAILKARSKAGLLAQIPLTVFMGSFPVAAYTLNGTGGEWVCIEKTMKVFGTNNYLRFYFGESGMEVQELRFEFIKDFHF